MVKKKTQSKRVSLSKRYMIEKKVKEHNRKVKKAARKDPNLRPKLKKDPGVPNLLPWKSDLLDAAERKKQEALELQNMTPAQRLEAMARKAQEQAEQFEDNEESSEEDFVDTSRKFFFKEFMKVVKASDVVIEVIDARDPLGTRCQDVEQQILKIDPNKKIILVVNKIDLVPRSNIQQWLQYLRAEMPTVAFKASTQKQKGNLSLPSNFSDVNSTSGCFGANNLMSLLKNYARTVGSSKKGITVGVIGFPNVGKSSLINSLKREKAAGVGATPGFTRNAQEFQLDKNISLYDSPGIVFSKDTSEAEAALHNSVRAEQIRDPIAPIELILARTPVEKLLKLYNIPAFHSTQEFLGSVAERRGRFKQGGIFDMEAAARTVLQDWNTGKIPFLSFPPVRNIHIDAEVVQSWSKAFNLSEVAKVEAEVITQMKDLNPSEFAALPAYQTKSEDMFALMNSPHLADTYKPADSDEESSGEFEDEPDDAEVDEGDSNAATNGDDGQMEEEYQSHSAAKAAASPKAGKARKSKMMNAEETAANPQHNAKLKADSKKRRQQDKKRKRDQAESMTAEQLASSAATSTGGDDDDFNFSTDFWSNVGSNQVVRSGGATTSPSNANKLRKRDSDGGDGDTEMSDFNV